MNSSSVKKCSPAGRPRVRTARAFTLLEMMLVVVIIGLLATVAVVAIGGRADAARRQTTIAKLSQVQSAITNYELESGTYPATLTVLVPKFINKVPPDDWKRALIYAVPSPDGKPFALYSVGKDGQPGTEDDINVWTMNEETPQNP